MLVFGALVSWLSRTADTHEVAAMGMLIFEDDAGDTDMSDLHLKQTLYNEDKCDDWREEVQELIQ